MLTSPEPSTPSRKLNAPVPSEKDLISLLTPARRMFFSISFGVPLIVLNHDDRHRLARLFMQKSSRRKWRHRGNSIMKVVASPR